MRIPRGSIIGAAVGLGIALLIGGAYLLGSSTGAARASAGAAASEEKPASISNPGPMYVLPDRVVNLADPGARRYLKIGLSIEFATGAAEFKKAGPEERKAKQAEFDKVLEPQVPLINDTIITLLAARTSSELATPEGKQKLKDDIKDSMNRILGGDQIVNVYFTQFVTQ